MAADRLQGMFTAAGWQVITVKYGRLLEELFARPGRPGAARPDRRHAQPGVPAAAALRPGRAAPPPAGAGTSALAALVAGPGRRRAARAIRNLGGHDLSSLDEAYGAIDDTRPTVILAYTIKGYGLAIEGHPQNHSALLTEAQLGELAAQLGTDPAHPWRAAAPDSAAGRLCRAGRPAAAPRGPAPAGAARRARRPRPHADRDRHHAGGARPDAARPDPGGAGGGGPGGDGEPGRQLEHQPRRLGEQGRRLVGPASGPTGSPTTPRRSCTGGRSPPGSTSSSASPRATWSA